MVFQKGDKVSFLNEALNGVVVHYINDSHVLVDCQGIEMDVSAQELIRITFIPKVEGKHVFPIKKEDKQIDEIPNLQRKASDYKKLSIGDLVSFMSDNTKGTIVAILPKNEYEVELEDGFSIPATRIEIEKIWVKDFSVDEKAIQGKIKKDLKKITSPISIAHQAAPKYFQHNEVDLHMESILDSCKGMSNFEIVTVQLNHFRKRLHEALQDNEPHLVVIHGVGKGVLKREIYKYLEQFPNIKVLPADVKLYGLGASEIRIY
tara:strand:+ start:490 stop:1275 length:786 start_codon:yes stop_codon:yes gene_type:complete